MCGIICRCTGMYIEVEKKIFEIFERERMGKMGRIYMKVGLPLKPPKRVKRVMY
jgi:hypothetical protein